MPRAWDRGQLSAARVEEWGWLLGRLAELGYKTGVIRGSAKKPDHHLGEDLSDLVASVGGVIVEVTRLAGMGATATFRLQLVDGRVLKGRRFTGAADAARVEYALRRLNHPSFPRVLGRRRSALLMEWVDGRLLESLRPRLQLLRTCGALHGFLHSVEIPARSRYRSRGMMRCGHTKMESRLAQLRRAGVIESKAAGQLLEMARRHAPHRYTVGLTHNDFNARNLVLRASGEVCVIDNETLAVGAHDYDLARTWYHWPMSASQRQAYLRGYHRYRGSGEFVRHAPYWLTAVVVDGAAFLVRTRPHAASTAAARLRRLLRDLRPCQEGEFSATVALRNTSPEF